MKQTKKRHDIKKEICWEHQTKQGKQKLCREQKRDWYDFLMLFGGVFFCLFSFYSGMCDILPGVRVLKMPEYTWVYVVVTMGVLAVLYVSGILKNALLRLLPLFAIVMIAAWYYMHHRLTIEDGVIYIARCYVAAINRHYGAELYFWSGSQSDAPQALLFWMLCVGAALFCVTVQKHITYMLSASALLFVSGIAVGIVPGWKCMVCLVLSVCMLCIYEMGWRDKRKMRMTQLACMLGISSLTATAFSPLAMQVVGAHEEVQKRQWAFEDRILALPILTIFEKDGMVTNDTPEFHKNKILTVTLSDTVTETIYFKEFVADTYKDGMWKQTEAEFSKAVLEQGLTEQEVGKQLWEQPYRKGNEIVLTEGLREALQGMALKEPKECTYQIQCNKYSSQALMPYTSSLPEAFIPYEDKDIQKKWTQRAYGGSMILGGREADPLLRYLQFYFMAQLWTYDFNGSFSEPASETSEAANDKDWYAKWVQKQYTLAQEPDEVAYIMKDLIYPVLGSTDGSDIRNYCADIQEMDTPMLLNNVRLSYALMVQKMMQTYGTYSRYLDELPAGADPISYFLETSKEGYCVHYASAATLILQSLGIPARYVTGYVAFPEDFAQTEQGYTATVIDERAHAWSEIYLEDFGWVPLEMTPSSAFSENVNKKQSQAQTEEREEQTPETPDEVQNETESEPDEPEHEKQESAEQEKKALKKTQMEKKKEAIQKWTYAFLGMLLGAVLIFWLQKYLRPMWQNHQRAQEQKIRRLIQSGQYRQAIEHMHERLRRYLRRKELVRMHRIKTDEQYKSAMRRIAVAHQTAVDVEQYMQIIRKLRFSKKEMSKEDACDAYRVYYRIRYTWYVRRANTEELFDDIKKI